MKKEIIGTVQNMMEKISLHSVGKSVAVSAYERKIPAAVLKLSKERQ